MTRLLVIPSVRPRSAFYHDSSMRAAVQVGAPRTLFRRDHNDSTGRADPNMHACLEGADAAVVITEWDEFRDLDLARLKPRSPPQSWSTCATSTRSRR
jgi:hypothetical protein